MNFSWGRVVFSHQHLEILGFVYVYRLYIYVYTNIHKHTQTICLWQLVLTNENRQQQNRFEQNQTTHSTGATSQCRTADECAFAKLDLVPKVVKLITVVPKLGYNRIFNTAENFTFNLRLILPPQHPSLHSEEMSKPPVPCQIFLQKSNVILCSKTSTGPFLLNVPWMSMEHFTKSLGLYV